MRKAVEEVVNDPSTLRRIARELSEEVKYVKVRGRRFTFLSYDEYSQKTLEEVVNDIAYSIVTDRVIEKLKSRIKAALSSSM